MSGGAPDHALGVLGRLAGAQSSVRVIEDDFEARILHANDAWEICAAQGRRFSCIPVSVGAEVSEQGFCWNVDHAQMPLLSDVYKRQLRDSTPSWRGRQSARGHR